MRNAIASLLVLGFLCSSAAADQARSGGTAGASAIKACSLLSKDQAMQLTPPEPGATEADRRRVWDLFRPEEEPVGKSGSACEYAGFRLQIDPFTWETLEAAAKKDKMTAVPDVGDAAYFGYRNSAFAEMMGRAGSHTFTIQMSVPFQSTPEKIKPNVIALGQAIVPKLK